MAKKSNEQIVLSLDTQKTIRQINADIQKLQKKFKKIKVDCDLDMSSSVDRIKTQIETLQQQINSINFFDNFNSTNVKKIGSKIGQTVADSVKKAIDQKKIILDKLNKEVEELNNNLSDFSYKTTGYNIFKTEITSIEKSLDSLKGKLKSDDNTPDLSSFLSKANTLKSINDKLKELNGIG